MGTEWDDFTYAERAPYLDAAAASDAFIAAEAAQMALCARAEAAEAALAAERDALRTQLKQAQDDGRLMLAHMGMSMWRRLDKAGRTHLEQELDSGLRNSTEDDGERIPYDVLYAYRRLLALGDFFDNPPQKSQPVAALPEPAWYTEREEGR